MKYSIQRNVCATFRRRISRYADTSNKEDVVHTSLTNNQQSKIAIIIITYSRGPQFAFWNVHKIYLTNIFQFTVLFSKLVRYYSSYENNKTNNTVSRQLKYRYYDWTVIECLQNTHLANISQFTVILQH